MPESPQRNSAGEYDRRFPRDVSAWAARIRYAPYVAAETYCPFHTARRDSSSWVATFSGVLPKKMRSGGLSASTIVRIALRVVFGSLGCLPTSRLSVSRKSS